MDLQAAHQGRADANPHRIKNAVLLAYTRRGHLVLKKTVELAALTASELDPEHAQEPELKPSALAGLDTSERLIPPPPRLELTLTAVTPNDLLLLLHRRRGQRDTDDDPLLVQNLESMRAGELDIGSEDYPLALALPRRSHPDQHLVLHFDSVRLRVTSAQYDRCAVTRLCFQASIQQDPFQPPAKLVGHSGRVHTVTNVQLQEMQPVLP